MPLSLLVPLALTAGIAPGGTARCAIGPEPVIQVQVAGLKDRSGVLRLELYPANEADFLKGDRELLSQGKVYRRAIAPTPAGGPALLCIRAPYAGPYALVVTHDRDGKAKFNINMDGVGLPGAERLGFRRPRLAQAMVVADAGVTAISVRMQYLQGLSGFGPVAIRGK